MDFPAASGPIRSSDLLANCSPIDVPGYVANPVVKAWVAKVWVAKAWVANAWGAKACARHSQPIRPNVSGIATCSW